MRTDKRRGVQLVAMPESLREQVSRFEPSKHCPPERECQRFLTSLEMTIRESDVSWSSNPKPLIPSYYSPLTRGSYSLAPSSDIDIHRDAYDWAVIPDGEMHTAENRSTAKAVYLYFPSRH